MLQKNKKQAAILPLLQFFFVLLSGYTVQAQIYYHNFGTTTINSHPYTVAPTTLSPNLSGSSWSNSTDAWASNTGASGQAIQLYNTPGTTTITLTFTVAPNFQVGVTSFNFWRQRSNSGPQAWQMSINGIDVGSGPMPTTGSALGVTPVLNPVAGLTGSVTVTLTLTGAIGAGNMRIDDFTLNGSVTSTCTSAVVTSYTPHTGPKDTMIIITGSGFTDTASVTIDGISMAFEVISDTEIHAMIPAGVTDGNIVVTATDGCFGEGGTPFTFLESDCVSPEVYISEIYDAYSGTPGSIELYNPGATPVNLSGYRLCRWGDIGTTANPPDYDMALTGTINPGSCYMVSINIGSACSGVATNFPLQNGINANDEFKLYKNSTELIDNVQIPLGSSELGGRGYTLIRKPAAIAPKPAFAVADWNVYGEEFCSNLGMHTANPVSSPVPLINHPAPRTVCVNTSTTFTAAIIPATGFTYQWKMLTSTGIWVNITNNGTYSGATTPTLTVNGVSLAMNNRQYYLQATSLACVIRTDAAQLFVLEPPAAPTVTVTQPTCTSPTGSIEITAPIDPDFTYSINGITYQPDTTYSALLPGNTYTITVKNGAGCVSNITTQAISPVPTPPAAPTVMATQPTCTTPIGSITVTAPIGAGYTYSIDGLPFQTGTIFTPVATGPHNITVQLNGCISPATVQTIDAQPATPAAPTVTAIQPTCTTPTGSITVTAPTGVGYTYSIDGLPYQTGTTFTPVAPGPHNITVQFNGCTSPATAQTIDAQPATPVAPTLTVLQPNCTTPTGSITVTAPTGAGYTYSIDGLPYQTGTTFTPVAPGPHNITVQLNGCTSPATAQTIDAQPVTPVAPTLTAVQPTCATPTGSITVTAPTGVGYTYSIDGLPFQTGTTFTPVATGPHNITVQLNGCTSPATVQTIDTQPATPAAPTVTVVQPTCANPTGSITVTTPLGADYTYSLDGLPFQTGTTFTPVAPGPHNITVQLNGCTSPATAQTIDAQPATPVAPTLTVVQPNCTTPTGSITVTAPIGAGYTYSIDGLPYQTGTTFTPVAPGPHNITVQLNGCTSPATTQNIDAQPVTPVAPTLTVVQPNCTTPTGSITVTAPTGAGYTYSIDGLPSQTGTTFTPVATGPHNITVQFNGCISPATVQTIDAQPATPVAPTLTVVQPNCTTPTGSITVTAPTGAGYTYSIDGLPYQTGTTFTPVATGPHNITVQLNGCTSPATTQTLDTQPATPVAPTLTAVQPTCTTPTGSITVTAPTGASYTYSIDGLPFQTGTTFTPVAPGPHNITVQLNGCTSPATAQTIDAQPATPVAPTLTVVQPNCTTPTGSITVTAPIGAGYTYSIDGLPYQTGTTFTPVTTGPHNITVQLNGCISPATVQTIDAQPATPAAPTVTAVQPTCTNAGSITVTAPTGAGYTYSIDGAPYQSGTLFTPVGAGSHTITVKTAAGCVSPATSQTIDPAPPVPAQPTLTVVQTTCTVNTGTITVSAPIGAGLTYNIDGGPYQTGNTFFNVPQGPHVITVKNAVGCVSAPKTETINPMPIAPDVPVLSVVHPGCNETKGIITVTSPVGNGFTYSIDGSAYQTGTTFGNLDPGNHTIIVKNAAGCLSNPATETINPPPVIPDAPVVTIVQPDCITTTGSITVVLPIEPGMMYSINNLSYQSGLTFNNLVPGNYVITSKNAAGCVSAYTHFVIDHPPVIPAVPVVSVIHPDCDKSTGTITVSSPTGFGLQYSINGILFQSSRIFDGVAAGTYTVTVINSGGCTATLVGVIVDAPPAPAPDPGTITGDSAVCEGGTIPLANIVTTGNWSSSNTAIATIDSNGMVTTLAPGTVTISYTTGTVCTASVVKTITVYALPEPELRDIYLCVDNDSGVTTSGVLSSGLNAALYDFTWIKDTQPITTTTSTLLVSEPGEYTVTATNKVTGCVGKSTATVGLSSIALAYADATVDFHFNQVITVHITGGSGDYEYSLNDGPYQDENYFCDIYEGQYHITVRDKNGCGVLELEVYALNYPRFFSPNGDGTRDTWNIKGLGLQPDAKIYIFDRYGKVIAGLKPGGQGWDGTYNGERLPATDYWFTLQYTTPNGEGKEFKAHFSLLR